MIFDDAPNMRETLREAVEDANMIPLVQESPIPPLETCIEQIKRQSPAAAIFDDHLSAIGNYATFTGVEAVKRLYLLAIPFVFVTTYPNVDSMKLDRQYIPQITKPEILAPDTIIQTIDYCKKEFQGIYSPERKPWRTLIRVVEIDKEENIVYVIVPNWDLNEKVRLPLSGLGFSKQHLALLKPDVRFFAKVNIDAENYDDLYFKDFEPPKPLKKKYADLIYS